MENSFVAIKDAAQCRKHVAGYTHDFYRYPARFSPSFVGSVIDEFSKPGDLVLDPYIGGGTTVVEALTRGRRCIGNDINSLSIFVTRVKTTPLPADSVQTVRSWLDLIPTFDARREIAGNTHAYDSRLRNMDLPKARSIRRLSSQAIKSAEGIEDIKASDFIRCGILRTAQWALDGKTAIVGPNEFKKKLEKCIIHMLEGMAVFTEALPSSFSPQRDLILFNCDASFLDQSAHFSESTNKVDLVVTSPPYPGVHVLYHRWQVDGRKETPAPYWIAQCNDGAGESHYAFGSRFEKGLRGYFKKSLETLMSIRRIMRPNALFVQMVAFNKPETQLPKYLSNMEQAGFNEIFLDGTGRTRRAKRIWRTVPNRKWHAELKGKTSSSREVVLFHKAEI